MTGVMIESLGGNCPVQAHGTICGHPFYFRARGEYWEFSVANKECKDPVEVSCGFEDGWRYSEDYGDGPFEAGWMTEDEARAFIDKAAKLFSEALND